jgi:PHD/YefM family antitoxin component YafN of YafNO toxin-antitoxin module
MRFSVSDPTRGGRMVTVIYSPHDDIPLSDNGTVPADYKPVRYKISTLETKIRKDEDPELLFALALYPSNEDNYLYRDSKTAPRVQPIFSMPRRGAVAKRNTEKDAQLAEALNYTIGEKKISNKKVVDIYKRLGFDFDLIENEDFEGMRDKLTAYAKTNSAEFLSIVKDSMSDVKARITDAFEQSILVASDARKITWGTSVEGANHKETICQYPIGADKIEYFSEWLVKKDETGEVRNKLYAELEKAMAV